MRPISPSRLLAALPAHPAGLGRVLRGARGRFAVMVVAIGLLAGTAGGESAAPKSKAQGNSFRATDSLPTDVQRVLVLPLTCDKQRLDLVNGCESLEQVLQAELAKTRKFEIAKATSTTLRSRTGRVSWCAEEPLPPKFFESLREAYGCDAVLFCHLTEFKAYAPLSVGWRLRLVDTRSQQTIWASDEVFDAAHSTVQTGVRKFEREQGQGGLLKKPEDWLALHSPRRFGEFALASVLATLPER